VIGRLKIWWRLKVRRQHHVIVNCDNKGIVAVYVDGHLQPKPIRRGAKSVSFWIR
jgi:hypothetical protein